MNQTTKHDIASYDVFISYSRQDKTLARELERALEKYIPPKELNVPQRRLRVFRDERDLTGTEYYRSIEQYIRQSDKLILLCSPEARKSEYVADEIRFGSF